MTTALDIITTALQDLGVIAVEESPIAAEASGALNKLNNMLDAWSIENLMVYGGFQTVFNLTAGQGVYTLGTGGDFSMPRPNFIREAYLRTTALPNLDTQLQVLTIDEYASLPFKGETSNMPFYLYYDNNFPLMSVYLNPVPTSTIYQLVLWTDRVLNNLALNDTISLPPAYKRAIEANLTLELESSYGRAASPSVQRIAMSSKNTIRRKNLVLNELSIDPRLTDGIHYDIRNNRKY